MLEDLNQEQNYEAMKVNTGSSKKSKKESEIQDAAHGSCKSDVNELMNSEVQSKDDKEQNEACS